MDKLFEAVAEVIVANGLPAVGFAAGCYVIYRLAGLYHDVQEKRILEGRETAKVVEANTTAMDKLSDLIRERVKG